MTVIIEPIADLAGIDDNTVFVFSAPALRQNEGGTGLITTRTEHLTATDGVLTTPDLDPGPAVVRIGTRTYAIAIPDSSTPIRLWPLIEAALPIPPAEEAHAVRNGGGIARVQVITVSAYAALTSPDPETEYSVIPD